MPQLATAMDGRELVERVRDGVVEVDLLDGDGQALAEARLGEVEQVCDQDVRPLRRAGDAAEGAALAVGERVGREQGDAEPDVRERIAEVVAHDADHLLGHEHAVPRAGVEARRLGDELFQPLPGVHELALVLVPVARDEGGDVVNDGALLGTANRIEHHRDRGAVAVHDVELHLGDGALHLQQRGPVRLVEDAPTHGEQLREPPAPDEVAGLVADPLTEGPVDAEEGPVVRRLQQTARGGVEHRERVRGCRARRHALRGLPSPGRRRWRARSRSAR
jgi:hypothetical protein